MYSRLSEISDIVYGKSPVEVIDAEGSVPIMGTGGMYGRASRPMFSAGIVVPRKGTLGNPQLVPIPFWPSDTTFAVIPKPGTDARWLFYCLLNYDLAKLNEATGVPSISRDWLSKIKFFNPGPTSQSRIGDILQTIDLAIEKTEALIDKYQQIKAGLMHDFFTRGIGPDGHPRPPRVHSPDLYQETSIGFIPKTWRIVSVGDALEKVIDFRGRTPKKLGLQWGGGDILALSANNVKPGRIDTSREAYFGSKKLYERWMTSGGTMRGDILLTMEAPLGNIAQVPDHAQYILSQRVIALRLDESIVANSFAFWQMQGSTFQRHLVKHATGTTALGIQRAKLVRLPLGVPSLGEQALIADRLFSAQRVLDTERKNMRKLEEQKSGLMHDLLTGKVRVQVEEPQADPAPANA